MLHTTVGSLSNRNTTFRSYFYHDKKFVNNKRIIQGEDNREQKERLLITLEMVLARITPGFTTNTLWIDKKTKQEI